MNRRVLATAKILLVSFGVSICLVGLVASEPTGDVGAWVASLEGGWYGEDNQTPMGRMAFAMLFDRQDDGSYVSHSAANRETFIRLRFFEDESGQWLLEESGGMEGLGQRGSTLVPAEPLGEIRRWVDPDDPDYLVVEMAVTGDELFVRVLVHEEEHAQLDLRRLPADQLPELRRSLAEAARRDPSEASIHDHANSEQIPETLRLARQKVAARPADAEARVALAGALIELIQSDPGTAPRYAGELLQTLQTAVELDPASTSAWQGLAGGSLDKAEEVAHKLLELDPQAGEALMAQVEQRRGGGK